MSGAVRVSDADDVAKAVSLASSPTSFASKIGICRALLITSDGEYLTFAGTDLALTATASVPVTGEPFACCAPASDVANFVNKLRGEVEFRLDGGRLHICAGAAKCDLPTAAADKFIMPDRGEASSVTVPSRPLFDAIRAVQHSMAPSNGPNDKLKAIYIEPEGDRTYAVAMCGHRMALYDIDTRIDVPPFLLPRESINSICKVLQQADEVTLTVTSSFAFFGANGSQVITKLVDGDYVDWRRVSDVPAGEIRFFPQLDSFKRSVSTVAAMRPTRKSQCVRFTLNGNGVELALSENHRANAEDYHACEIEGEGFVGMNPAYVIDALNQIDGEPEISFSDAVTPVQITQTGSPLRQFITPRRA